MLKAVGLGMSVDLRRWDTVPAADRGTVRDTTSSPARLWAVENPPSLPDTTMAVGRPAAAAEDDLTIGALSAAETGGADLPATGETTLKGFRALKEM